MIWICLIINWCFRTLYYCKYCRKYFTRWQRRVLFISQLPQGTKFSIALLCKFQLCSYKNSTLSALGNLPTCSTCTFHNIFYLQYTWNYILFKDNTLFSYYNIISYLFLKMYTAFILFIPCYICTFF